ncbi:MAG: hypothetical protein ABSC02_11375 [Acidobacteriota bacterium]|jgi:hypothetical protein
MNQEEIPGRIFLDTCIINFILDYGEQIHEGIASPRGLSERALADIDAFYNIFLTGQRAQWQLAISPHSYQEVAQTQDSQRRRQLESWFSEIWHYWRGIIEDNDDLPSFIEAEHIRFRLLTSTGFDVLPDLADRVLLCDAVVYRCNLFCTRDWSTILKQRSRLPDYAPKVVTPSEWWSRIRSYGSLWA